MYEATKKERKILIEKYKYDPNMIDLLEAGSDSVRRGTPVDISVAFSVIDYQEDLQAIRKSKKWWQFWK